jgi:hypothetical protein|tara:strand:- start:170 stop:559 length:390 start_codon:yes stop_codon:yes gene_type:complete
VVHNLTHLEELQTQQDLEFLLPEEDKELRNGVHLLDLLEVLEAEADKNQVQLVTVLEVVTLVDIVHPKEMEELMEPKLLLYLGEEQAEAAEELHNQVSMVLMVMRLVMVVMVMEHKLVQLMEHRGQVVH